MSEKYRVAGITSADELRDKLELGGEESTGEESY